MSKETLKVGDWIQYIAINGQSQHGKVDRLVEDMNEKETRVDLKLLNGQKDSIWINHDWIKTHPNKVSLLDEKYNERNKQSNDLQQRKRSCGVINSERLEAIHPGEWVIPLNNSERAQFIEQVVEGFDAVPAYNIGKAIEHIFEHDSEQAKKSLERAYENWD